MKKLIFSIVYLFLVMQGNAQFTSISQLKDIKRDDDNYYEAIKNLVELYGVLGVVEKRQGNNYLPAKPLTHRSFAIVMVAALDKVEEKLDRLSAKTQEMTRDSLLRLFRKKHFKGYADSAVKDLSGWARYKDINTEDPDYTSVKRLTDYYNIKLGDTYNTFSADKVMTGKELNKIFNEYFGARSIVNNASAAIVTRGKWAVYLNTLLERLYEIIIGMTDE